MSIDNLNPVRTKEEARERGTKGGVASGKARRKKKLLREYLERELAKRHDGMETFQAITLALIEKALTGDTKAYEIIRDTLGQKPKEAVENTVSGTLEIRWQ